MYVCGWAYPSGVPIIWRINSQHCCSLVIDTYIFDMTHCSDLGSDNRPIVYFRHVWAFLIEQCFHCQDIRTYACFQSRSNWPRHLLNWTTLRINRTDCCCRSDINICCSLDLCELVTCMCFNLFTNSSIDFQTQEDLSESPEGDAKYLAPELMKGHFGKPADVFR